MAAIPSASLISVDTNVLIDLADENEIVWDSIFTLRQRCKGCRIAIVPTVIQELAILALNPTSSKRKSNALLATSKILEWGFNPVSCVPVRNGIVEETARKIQAAGLLPEEEVSDAFVLSESALLGAVLLLSNDRHLRDVPHAKLKPVLQACDLDVPLIVSPFKVSTFFLTR